MGQYIICIIIREGLVYGLCFLDKYGLVCAAGGYGGGAGSLYNFRAGGLVVCPVWFTPASAAVLMCTYTAIVMIDRLYGLGTPALKLHCK